MTNTIDISCPWDDYLVADMQKTIINLLDPLAQRMCAMTSKSMRCQCPDDVKKITDRFHSNLDDLYLTFGTLTQLSHCRLLKPALLKMRHFELAAEHGNLDTMKWLKDNNCPWNRYTFAKAAGHGNLDNMKWLRVNYCPWNRLTFACAAA